MKIEKTAGAAPTAATGAIINAKSDSSLAQRQRPRPVLTSSPIELVVSRLGGVKKTGYGRWIARCPAHDDRSPSLTIRELDDGRLLVHCFGGCDVSAVVGAIGLTLADLFPSRENYRDVNGIKPQRAPFSALDVLRALRHEALVIAMAAAQIVKDNPLSEEDAARVALAYRRIHEAVRLAGGDHVR